MSLQVRIPKIAITPEEDDDEEHETNLLNLVEALTDVEELLDDQTPSKKIPSKKKLKIKVTESDGYNTAIEDVEASDEDDSSNVIIQHVYPISMESLDLEQFSTEENYGISQKKSDNFEYFNIQSSKRNDSLHAKAFEQSDEFLTDIEDYDTENELEEIDITVPQFDFDSGEALQVTTIIDEFQTKQEKETDQTPHSPKLFPETLVEKDELKPRKKPPTFSQMMRGRSGQTKLKKKKRNKCYGKKSFQEKERNGNDSSENEMNQKKSSKTILSINSLNYDSDIEEEKKLQFPVCKKTFAKNKLHLKMPEFEINDKTDVEDFECDVDTNRRRMSVNSTLFQEQLDKMASCYSFTNDKNESKVMTDGDQIDSKPNDLNSPLIKGSAENNSEDNTEHLLRTNDLYPMDQDDAENDTEEEFIKGMCPNISKLPEIVLPPTTRTLVLAEENKSLIPTVRILPLSGEISSDSECEEKSTDGDSLHSETDLTTSAVRILYSPLLPYCEMEDVKVSENSVNPFFNKLFIEEVATDVEELDGDPLKQQNNMQKIRTFLSPNDRVDYNDQSNNKFDTGGHTDLEYLDSSDDDTFAKTELQRTRKLSLKLRSPVSDLIGQTDTEELWNSTDDEINYSRAETATPLEKVDVDDKRNAISYELPGEVMYLKGGASLNFHDEVNFQDVMDAWEYFNHTCESNVSFLKYAEWTALEDTEKLSRSEPDTIKNISVSPVHWPSDSSEIRNSLDTNSYTQIDAILERMLLAVDDINMSHIYHTNSLTLEPSSDALIEIPINKSKSKGLYTTTANLFVIPDDLPSAESKDCWKNEEKEDTSRTDDTEFSSNEYLDSNYTDDIFFSNESEQKLNENLYEPIDTHISRFTSDPDYIWYEGTFRNLSVVLEEDEDYYNSKSEKLALSNDELNNKNNLEPSTSGENTDYASESSQIFTSVSTDESENDNGDQTMKAEIKLMITSQEDGLDAIEVKSMKEFKFQEENKRKTKKTVKLTKKLMNILDRQKSGSVAITQTKDDKKFIKPSFTIPRIFMRNSKTGESSCRPSNVNIDIIAKPNDNFPLAVRQIKNENEEQTTKIDLFANIPFYPVYTDRVIASTTGMTYIPPSDVTISEAYCNWSTDNDYHRGKTTPTQCLIMHDVKLTDAKIDPPEVAFPLIESQNFKASQEAAADSEYSGVKISSEKVRVNDKDTSQKLPTTNTQELAILNSSHDCLEHTKKTYGNELPEENLCGKSKNRSSQENSPSRSSLNIPNEDEEKTNNFEEPKNIIHRTTSEFLRKEKEGHEAYDTEVSVVSEPRIAHSMQLKPSRSQEHQDVLRNNVRSESKYEDSYSDNYYIKEMKIQIAPICTREASNEFLKKETEYYDDVMLVGSSNARTADSSLAQDKIKDLSEISDEQLKEGNNNLEKPNDTKSLKSNKKSGFITLFRTKSKNHDRFENGGSETTGLDKEKFALANGKSQTVILPSEHETQTKSSTEELRNSYSKNFADKNEFSTQLRETTSAFLNKELKEYHDAEYPKILSIKQKTDTDLEENSKTVEILNHADEECIEINQTENRDAGGKKKKSRILSFLKVKSQENNKIENNNGDIGIEQKIINRKISVKDQEMIKDPSEDVEISFTEIAETEAGVDPSHFESEQKIIEQENVNLPTVEDLQKQVENTKRSITSKFVEPPTIKAMNNKETVIGSNKTNKIVVVPQQLQNVTHNFLRNEKTSYDLCPVFKDDGRKSQQDFVPVIENKSDDRVPEAKSNTKDGRIINNRIQKPESFKYQIKINSKVRNENLITPMMSSFNFLLNEKKNYESNVIPNHLTKTETMNELSKKEGKEPSNICISQNMFDYEFKNSNDKEMGEYIRREDKMTLEVTDQNNSIEFPNDNIPLKNSDSNSEIFSEIYDNRGYLKKLNEETEISSSPEIAFELESNDHIHKNNKEIICEEKPDDTEKQNEISHEKRADSTESSGSNEHRTKNEKDKKEKNSKSTQKSKFNILGYFRKKYKSGKDSEDITREEDEIIQSELKELTSSFLLEERMKYEDDGEKPEKIYNKEIPVENIHEIMISRPLNGKSGKQEIEVVSFVSQSNTSPLEVVEKHIQITPAFLEGEKKYECGKPAVDDQYSFISRSEHLIRNENSEKDFQSNKRNTTDFLRREKMLSDSGYLQERAHILKEAENALKISEIESDSITKPPENVEKKHESIQKNEVSNKDDRNEKVSHRSRDKKPKSKLAFFIKKSRDSEKASKSAKNFEKKEDEEKTKKNEGRFFSSGHKQQDIQGNKNKSSTILGLFKKKDTINKDQTPTYHNADDFMKILEDTKTFLSNENEMYSDGIPTYDEKNNSVNFPHESEENENHLTITSEEVISKVENRPQEAQATDAVELTLPEYTAFDFIREEVENFENSKLPNTSQIDSSIRVETETETIDGDSPKEIITKKIFISEKLVEQKESRGAPIMSHEILKALMKVEKDFQGHVYMEEETDEPSEHGDSNFEKVDTYGGLEMEKNTNETELSRNGEIQEMNEDLVSKMKDTLMKKNNVIEDVSHLEEKFFVPNEMEKHEIVTDLDDSTSDEQSSIDARYPESSGECKRKKYTVSFEDEEANIVKKERENCYKLSEKGSITKFHEQNTTVPDVIYASEDFVEDLKVQFTPHTEETNKSGSAPCAEVNISSNTAKRKPLFKIESEEEAVCENIIDSTVRQRQELDNRLLELRTGTANETTDNIPIRKITVENEKGRIENVDIETIEKKLCDLGVAIDTLEKFEKCENPVEDYTKERKLRRIERKFERMASDAGEKTENTINDQYQELVSQLSQEEVMSFQGEYNNLWDEYTFSKSDEWDSKTPDSQADVLELPQDPSCKELTDASQKIPTNIQPPQPRPRHQKSKEQVDEIVIEPTPKQISPVRDDILDDREKIEDISYQDKKKFWENITKEPSKKQSDLSKRNTVHQITSPPKPKPRGALQFSYSVSEATTENTSLIEYKHEDIVVSEEKQSSLVETEEIHSSETQKEKQASDDKVEEMKKTDSVDTEENSSQAEENAGYISDSGDVEHYISDSEIEDRVPQIRERQMSVFVPPSVSQRTRYERSASLPTEDLYEVSARSTKLRKQYYEEQMRKEMIQEQLNIDLEDEGSPERKSLSSPEGKIEKVSTEIPTNERPNISGTIFESEFEQCPEEESKDDQRKFSFEENENREIHVDKSETEKSEKVHSKTASEERPQEKIPEITFTLSGKQRRISEESDEYAVEKIVTISPVPEQVEISEEDQKRETKKEEKLLETLTEIEESSIKCQERISEEISFTHEHKQEPEMKKQIEDIEEVLLIASISEDTQKDSLPDGNINEVKELENLKTDYTEPNTNAHSPAESQVEKISVVDQNIEETAEHPKISATEKTLDNELADIDLENEDLKNIVSRLESMHKFKKFKASSKISVKTKASEKDPNADAPKNSSQHSEGKEEKDEKYCGPVPIPDETKSTKKIGNIEFVENVRDLTFTQVKAVKGEILETCIPQVSVEKDIKPFVSYVDESSKTDEKYVAESEKFHSPTELITTTEENKKAEKETFDKHSEMSEKNVSFSSSEISKQNTEKVYIKSTSSIQETYEILSILKKKSAIKKDLNSPEKEQILSKTYLKPELADLVESHSLRSVQDDKAVSSTDGAESKTEMTKLIDETNEISSKPEWHTRDVTSEEIISSDVGASQLASHSEEDSTNVKATSGENDSRDRSHDDYKTIKQPQENIENTIWEVSVESEVMKEEKLCTFPSCERESADMKSESFSDKVNDENITDETNLDSDKLDSELSDSLRSMKSDNHNDMKRMILESLEQQKVDPEEAKLIAESLIEEIESELQKVENFNRELSSKSDSVESDKHVTDYLKELAEVKGLEQREVELVESVLERRKRQISRLSRGDTQASSMEITDEDLRFSETDYDYSNILQQQMGQLEAQCSDHMKKVYDSLVEDQSAASVSNDDAKLLKQAEDKDIKEEKQIIEEVMKQRKDVILEEDENITEASTDELDLNKMETAIDDSYDSALTKDKIHKKSVKRSEEWTKQVVEKCDEVSEFEQKLDDGVVEKYSTEETEIDETKENEKEAIKRTSSSDSKSSVGSSRTQDDIYSTCSSSKKLESESSAEVVLRRAKREQKKTERKSQIELETYSSSGESHYHSFEIDSKSRPCSSDLEGIVPTGSSEYESALNSQELSMKSQLTSGEYHTAISSLSSKESMMSIESESSGNLASIEISETSETLVPTNSDLEGDIDMADQQMLEDNDLWQTAEPENREPEAEGNLNECSPTSTDAIDIAPKMKRSHEMTFQPEPRVLTSNSPQMEPNDIDERFGTSLDDGSALSVSLSSTSSAQLRTVIELSRTESIGPEESITSAFSDHASLEDDLAKTPENITLVDSSTSTHFPTEDPIESVTILSATVSDNGVMSVCSQVTTETVSTSVDNQKSNHEELKRKGHRRQDSTSFIPTLIHGAPKSSETQKLHDFSPPEITGETTDREFHDLSIRRESGDRRDSHGKSSSTSSEKSSFEEAEAEAAFNMVAHISPVHKIKQICPIMEDIDAEKLESEARENARKEKMEKAKQIRDASPGPIPDIKVTEHLAPLDESNFRYPELEIEREELERESQKSADESHDGEDVPKTDDTENKKNTSDISSYTKEGICENKEIEISESVTKEREPTDKSSNDEERASDSPNSDSFELVEKPDIIDDFVVIEEIGKEASEMDSEGKSMAIQSKPKSHRKHDEEIDAYLARSDPTPLTKMTELKYFPPDGNYDLEFEFEDSPPQAKADSSTKEYGSKYDQELEANRKWIEQQFHGDHAAMAAAGYAYEVEFERGPLEDIKEEDINDMDQASSRIGSLGSQKESGGSLGSIKDSYSSTPEYDVLAGRRYFTRSGEHDDISMSSLQEFENLERAMSLETKRMYHGSGSQESSSNGSFKTRYYASKGQGDDISVSSLKEFEGLEKACIAAYKTEVKVKEEEALLSQIEEVQESQPEKQDKETSDRSRVGESDGEDYEKRMFEIDEIIRQAQNNVERFVDLKEAEKTESLGRGDSIEEVSKVPDLDLDTPLDKSATWKEDDPMVASTDSLDLEQIKPIQYGSTDSLDQKNAGMDVMTASTDSIEMNNQLSRNITSDSMENKTDGTNLVCSDSLDIAAAMSSKPQIDSLEEDDQKIFADHSSSDTGKDFSSSVKDDVDEHQHELMLGSTDSLEHTSSTATHATYQYETDSVYSGSFTSGGSITMVSSTDTIDPNVARENIDIAAAVRKVWFDEGTSSSGKDITTEYIEESSMPYVTEVIEPSDDPAFSHTIHRRVQMPVEVRKVTFHGKDADQKLEQFIKDFGDDGEEVHETEEIDSTGNIHTRRVVQKRFVIRPDELAKRGTEEESTSINRQIFEMCPSQLTTLTKTIAGETSQPTEITDAATTKAQTYRRRTLRYDISVDDQTEVDPREHDWLFNLTKDDRAALSLEKESEDHCRQQPFDQYQLSQEMKDLLKEMEEASKK